MAKVWQFFGQVMRFFSVVVVLFTLLSYLCPHVNPAVVGWVTFFGTAFPWLLLANVLLFMIWAVVVDRFALYHLGVVIFGWQFVVGFVGFGSPMVTSSSGSLRVMTHNLGGLYRSTLEGREAKSSFAALYVDFLRRGGVPDILCTQETTAKFYREVARRASYPHTFNLNKGTVILSKHPMEAGGEIPFKETDNSSIWVDIRYGSRLVRVINLHLQSNRVTGKTEQMLEQPQLEKRQTWSTIRWILGRVGRATRIRAAQAEKLRDFIRKSPHPVIICGDFNDTPNSYVYKVVSAGMRDTFRDRGFGLGTTFGGGLPLLRIDYILTDTGISVLSCETIHNRVFSDHYPVVVHLQ